jgi:hypothetical protein
VAPCTEQLAEVTLQPHGDQVKNVTLARSLSDDKWELLRANVANGKIKLPPGDYRFFACTVFGDAAPRRIMASARQSVVKPPVTYAAGQPNTLACGAPLEIKVTTAKRLPEEWESRSSRAPKKSEGDSDYLLSINARVVGAGGEMYSSYGTGKDLRADPSKPTFSVADAGGKKLASGNLEFG